MAAQRALLAQLLALAIPVSAGLAYMVATGAPPNYISINAAALCIALAWIVFGRLPSQPLHRRLLSSALLAILALPILAGPEVNGVTRWINCPLSLHSGMLAIPVFAVLAAQDLKNTAILLLCALFLTLLQPDAASAFAITFAAVGLHHSSRDWRIGLVAIISFITAIVAALRAELPAEPFVDRVLVEAAHHSAVAALGLAAALLASFLLIRFHGRPGSAERLALAGTLFGFAIMSLMSNYPTPLIGYGAAPILGYGLALAVRQEPRS